MPKRTNHEHGRATSLPVPHIDRLYASSQTQPEREYRYPLIRMGPSLSRAFWHTYAPLVRDLQLKPAFREKAPVAAGSRADNDLGSLARGRRRQRR
jgi:hypothetical protein